MNRTISELFDLGEAPKLQGPVPAFDPQEIKEMTMKHIQNISQNHPAPRKVLRRTTRTLLIAAVIASLLTVTALAVGLSIHQRRQSELREALLVEENQLTGYVEAILPETSGAEQPGLVLLSTINDGEFQRVYVNISPISKEEVFSLGKNLSDDPDKPISHELSFTLDGEHFGIVQPQVNGEVHSVEEAIASSYDEATQTLTAECACPIEFYHLSGPFTLSVRLYELSAANAGFSDASVLQDFGTVTVTPTDTECRTVFFPTPIPIENPVTGGKGQVVGAELMSLGVNWLVEHEHMETIYDRQETEEAVREQNGWLQAIDAVTIGAELRFADGSAVTMPGAVRTNFEDGYVKDVCTLGQSSINIHTVTEITMNGVTNAVS